MKSETIVPPWSAVQVKGVQGKTLPQWNYDDTNHRIWDNNI